MKNKVLVAMGIGVAAAMVPAVASTADVIDLENLTQEQIDTIEKIEEAEATNEQEEVNFGNDGDLLDDAEVHLVPDAAPIQEGSLSVGSDDKENPVHYADIILNNNVKEEFSELNTPTPSPSPSASPVVSASPMPSIEPRPSDAPAADRVSGTALVLEGGSEDELVPSASPVDMAAKQKAEQKAEELKNAGFEDVNITTEEIPANLPDFVDGIKYSQNNDPIPTASREDIINDLLIMKKMGGFEELIPYDEEALKNLTDEDLQKFKNIKVLKETKTFSNEGLTREVLIGAVKDLKEAGVKSGTITFIIDDEEVEKSLQDLTDEDIDNLTDEQLEGLKIGFAKTTITDEAEISAERQTGLTQAQLAEQLTLLRAAGYDALEHKALCQFFGVDTNQSIEEDFYKWSFEDLERLGLAAGITVETKPIEFTEDTASTRQGLTRDKMLEALSELQEDGYEALAGVNLDNVANMSDEELNELLSEVIAIEELHITSAIKPLIQGDYTVLNVDAYNRESRDAKAKNDYEAITITYYSTYSKKDKTVTYYIKHKKIGETLKDDNDKTYDVTGSGLQTITIDNIDINTYQPKSNDHIKYITKDGVKYVITGITKVQNAVTAGTVIEKDAYDKLTETEKANFDFKENYVWITRVSDGYKLSERTLTTESSISVDNIDEYSVIALSSFTSTGTVNGKTYVNGDANTNSYFTTYHEMLVEAAGQSNSTSELHSSDPNTTIKKFCDGPKYSEGHNAKEYDTPVYYVTSTNSIAVIDVNTKTADMADGILNAVFVVDGDVEKVIVNGINGVVIAPGADIYLVNNGEQSTSSTGTVVGNNVYNTGKYYAYEEIMTQGKVLVEKGHVQYYVYDRLVGDLVEVDGPCPGATWKWIPNRYEDGLVGTGQYQVNEKEDGSALTLNTGKIDIVGQDVRRYKAKETKKAVYNATAVTFQAKGQRTEYSYSPEDQPASFTFDPITQPAKAHYTYEYNASVDNYGMIATPKFYKYTVTGHMATTISYYGEAVVDTPPVAPPPTPDDEIITTTLVFGDPVDVADDFVAAPLAAPVGAVLGANREIEGTVLGAQVSGSVLGERRGPQGAVLGKRRSPKTADAAMGGMIAGMMLSMMTAFGGATVLKKKRKDEE